MKLHHIGIVAGGFLLVAAQDAPEPPGGKSTFSEAFSEQSNAAKAVQAAEELDKPAPEQPAAAASDTVPSLPEPVVERPEEPDAPPAQAVEPAREPAEPPSASVETPEDKPAEAGEDSVETPPAPAVEPEAAPKLAKGDPVTRDFLVGIWAEPGKSCEAGIDFQADGRMIGPFPRWELTDGELTMVGNRQKMRLTVVDQDTMQSRRSETDPPRTLKRCPKAPLPPKP